MRDRSKFYVNDPKHILPYSRKFALHGINAKIDFLTLILESLTLIFVMVMNAVGAFDLSKDSR